MSDRQAAAVRGIVLMLGAILGAILVPAPFGALVAILVGIPGAIVAWLATLSAGRE